MVYSTKLVSATRINIDTHAIEKLDKYELDEKERWRKLAGK